MGKRRLAVCVSALLGGAFVVGCAATIGGRDDSCDFVVKNRAIFISTPEVIKASDLELKIYDVRDLVLGEAAPMPWKLETHGARDVQKSPDVGLDGMTPSKLVEMVRARIGASEWSQELGTSVEERGGKLVVMQRPVVHAEIARFLQSLGQQGVLKQEE